MVVQRRKLTCYDAEDTLSGREPDRRSATCDAGFCALKETGQGGLEPPTSGFGDNQLAQWFRTTKTISPRLHTLELRPNEILALKGGPA
jgi:hypothetical protein